jgi:hypothetical protein
MDRIKQENHNSQLPLGSWETQNPSRLLPPLVHASAITAPRRRASLFKPRPPSSHSYNLRRVYGRDRVPISMRFSTMQ